MISSGSDTGTGGACANAWGHSDARGARADTRRAGSDARGARADTRRSDSGARRDPDARRSGAPTGRHADTLSADADARINGKCHCGDHQRHPDDNNGCKSHHDAVPFISTRAAPWPKDTLPEQARSRH